MIGPEVLSLQGGPQHSLLGGSGEGAGGAISKTNRQTLYGVTLVTVDRHWTLAVVTFCVGQSRQGDVLLRLFQQTM